MDCVLVPKNEILRLKELDELHILDTDEENEYDAITKLAASISNCPIALVSLVDQDRQWFKSHYGLEARETPRDLAFCAHAILQKNTFIVEDALLDERFKHNPLVSSNPKIRFYAGVPLITAQGNALGTLCIIDTVPRKLTSNQIESLVLLGQQVVTLFKLRSTNLQILDEAKAKIRFLNSINHEMRTPLNILNGYIDIISDEAKEKNDADTIEYTHYAKGACEQLLNLIKDMVDQSSIDSGRLAISPSHFELIKHIHNIASECKHLAGEKQIVINVQFEVYETVYADENRVRQIMHNLISNAIKYGSAESVIKVNVEQSHQDFINIRVTNHGKEIGDEDKFQIFDRYYRSPDYERGCISGLGLGLPIAKQLALAHGGDLLLESSVNSMTTFLFKLKR